MKPNKIVLKGDPIVKEGDAASAITPGHLVTRNADGDIVVHGAAGQNAIPAFADMQDYIGGGIDKAYAVGDRVKFNVHRPGDEVYALLADGENVTPADNLESAGDGTLRKHTPQAVAEGGAANYTLYQRAIVARPIEAVNNSVGGAAVRIKVEVQ